MSENVEVKYNDSLAPEKISKKDVTKAWARVYYADEIPHSFDRYIAASLTWALMPILQKLYKDKDDLIDAYERHLLFFNSEVSWGESTITGIMASMEQARAQEMYEGKEITITDDLIYNTKAGLMGALAGIGDSISSGTVQYIFIALAIPWAQQGSAAGALVPFILFSAYQLLIGYYLTHLGFSLGRNVASEVTGSRMQQVINTLSILGLFMMGILAGSYVNVESTLTFGLSGREFVIQEILDGILPGLLPLLTVGGVYFYFEKKEFNVTKAMIGLTIILGALAAIGIL